MLPQRSPSVAVSAGGFTHPGSDPLRTVVWVDGEHDTTTRTHLSLTIAEAAGLDDADVVVDLSGITFMDASTIGAIVAAHNGLRACSRSLSVRAPSRLARRLLDVCELAFLIDGRSARPAAATALDTWVAVPASDRASGSTTPPADPEVIAREPAEATAPRRAARAGSVHERRAP